MDTEERKHTWDMIYNEQHTRKQKEQEEQMAGDKVQWRCTCTHYTNYMERSCVKCAKTANHLNMIMMTKAEWKIWEDEMSRNFGQELLRMGSFPLRDEFLNAGIACTYQQYDMWRQGVVLDKERKKVLVSDDKYVRKKINEYNIQKTLEIKHMGNCTMNAIINEGRIRTLRDRMDELRGKIDKMEQDKLDESLDADADEYGRNGTKETRENEQIKQAEQEEANRIAEENERKKQDEERWQHEKEEEEEQEKQIRESPETKELTTEEAFKRTEYKRLLAGMLSTLYRRRALIGARQTTHV